MLSIGFVKLDNLGRSTPSDRQRDAFSARCTAAIAAFALSLLLAACDDGNSQQAAAPPPPPAVTVTPVVAKKITKSIQYVGRTHASQAVDVRARVNGFLIERSFEEGGPVSAEQKLFQIDPDEFEAARKAASAEVQRIEASLVELGRNLARAQQLIKRGNISQAAYDKAVADEAQARAALAAAKADLERAEINVSYATIKSPISGAAGAASIHVGNLVGPDSGVLTTIVNTDPIRVEFAISERELLNYRARKQEGSAQAFTPRIRLANGKMFDAPGTITFVDNQVDPRTGTIKVRAEFPNPSGLVTPGQFVQVILSASEPQDALLVPQAAVQANQAGTFVLVVGADDKVDVRPVKLENRDGASIVVTEGLRAGELVIVAGLQKVRPGATVKPVQAAGDVPGTPGS